MNDYIDPNKPYLTFPCTASPALTVYVQEDKGRARIALYDRESRSLVRTAETFYAGEAIKILSDYIGWMV